MSHYTQALFLPEATDYIASSPAESISLALPMSSSPFLLGLQKSALENKLAINVGIHVPAPNNKLYNRSCWINEKGEIESYYDKLHLFDYGTLRESNSVQAGTSVGSPVETVVGRVGLMVCFDVSPWNSILNPHFSFINLSIATLSGNISSTKTSKCPNYDLSFGLHHHHRPGALGGAVAVESH